HVIAQARRRTERQNNCGQDADSATARRKHGRTDGGVGTMLQIGKNTVVFALRTLAQQVWTRSRF
ncbi:MAG TPA: hypothetical protein DCW29_25265, partial [Janthinobacterium sp.]|nr:hypothetical protein [Janthinobacterium sp.]